MNKGNRHVALGGELFSGRVGTVTALLALTAATAAVAQTAPAPDAQEPAVSSTRALNLPSNPQVFGNAIPSVVKATAIINGDVITQTDVDQRVALFLVGQNTQVPPEQMEEVRQQVLRNLIDETLQIQAARAEEITITDKDIDRTVLRVAQNANRTPEQFAEMLKSNGSSMRSIRRQIHGELAWSRLQRAKIEDTVSVGDDEVQAVLDRLNAAKGAQEYRVGEIFISTSGRGQPEALASANRILEQIKQGGSFQAYARQFSEATTAAVGGDLGWVRAEQMPDQLASVLRQMTPGVVSNPIPIAGGVSILAVQDTRKILTADPRNAVLSLKQVSITFPEGATRATAEPIVNRFAEAARTVGGCGGAERIANDFNAELVQSDQVKLRELPAALQEIMLPLQVGQSTPPFGSVDEGVRILVVCGRDEVTSSAPSFEQVLAQMSEERVNLRARRYLRDLRRDAVIEFR